jgi:CubicO group peptidase (beta-lactamase class C family)
MPTLQPNFSHPRGGRRLVSLAVAAALMLGACSTSTRTLSASTNAGPEQQKIAAIARASMTKYHLKALILRVTTDGRNTYTGALGSSMTGVPATPAMHVRNGFVAYSYLTTVLLELVDRHKISLGDMLSKYLPHLPRAKHVTIKMLANSTSGYADYVDQPAITPGTNRWPFRQWTTRQLIRIGTSARPTFPPGTNWAYAHTNYAILGKVLEKAGGEPLGRLMQRYIFRPMGLRQTQGSTTPQIPEPVLHTFSSERRQTLGVPAGRLFYEDSTYWNPSWTAPRGASQTSDVADLTTSIAAIGSGKLLSAKSHRAQVGPHLVGFGHPQRGCPACARNTKAHSFGLGVILQGPWITGNKFYAGSGAEVGYLPSKRLAIAVITTYKPSGFNRHGVAQDAGPAILATLAKALAPKSPIPQ